MIGVLVDDGPGVDLAERAAADLSIYAVLLANHGIRRDVYAAVGAGRAAGLASQFYPSERSSLFENDEVMSYS